MIKIYISIVLLIYAIVALALYLLLIKLNIPYVKTVVLCSLMGALVYHFFLESVIDTDDYDKKDTLKSYIIDFPYCFSVGMVAFFSIAVGSTGVSFITSGKYLVGCLLLIAAIVFYMFMHKRKIA